MYLVKLSGLLAMDGHGDCLLELTKMYAQVSTTLNEPDSGRPHGEVWLLDDTPKSHQIYW